MVEEIVVFMINLFVEAILSVPYVGEHSRLLRKIALRD